MNYREQFYEGEIDGKALLDVIDEKEAEAQSLREEVVRSEQHRNGQADLIVSLRTEVAALRARVVVAPERHPGEQNEDLTKILAHGWNACLAELTHLNGKTVSEGLLREARRHLGNWLELHECECEGGFHYCGREQVAKTHRELRALLGEGKEAGNG